MTRLVALAAVFALAAAAPAQFVRPPTPPPVRPPTPFFPRPNPVVPLPQTGVQRPYTSQPQTPRVIPPNPGLLAAIGGVYAARTPVYAPSDVIVVPSRPAVDWPAMQAVVGSAGIPWVTPQPPAPLPPVLAPAPPANDWAWVPWAILGTSGLTAAGVVVAGRLRRGRVRITAVPPGEAPEWVRRAWVGVELPTLNREPKPLPAWQVSTRRSAGSPSGFAVSGAAAVKAVAAVNPDAGEWWRANAAEVLRPGYQLVFPAEVCERLV